MTEHIQKHILIVDDDKDNVSFLQIFLRDEGYDTAVAANGEEALAKVKLHFYSVILLDLRMPKMDGMETLERLKEESPQSLVLIFSAYGNEEQFKRATQLKVFDFIEKPVKNNILKLKIDKAKEHSDTLLESAESKKAILAKYPYQNVISNSPQIRELMARIEKLAAVETYVLITGETGTGKGLFARALHYRSVRAQKQFIHVNTAGLPETLLEAELFGHEKGAFTDAKARKFGYFESAVGGTIFLDEIGEISEKTQVNLLRVLQDKQITRLGGTESIDVNARVITATNRNLEKMVAEGRFREDLYYRINRVRLHLPSLRERREDIPLLANFFIMKYTRRPMKFSDEALTKLMEHSFPGNIRELESIIEQAVIFAESDTITPRDLSIQNSGAQPGAVLNDFVNVPWKEAKERFEKHYLETLLEQHGDNLSRAADISGIDRSELYKKMDKLSLRKK